MPHSSLFLNGSITPLVDLTGGRALRETTESVGITMKMKTGTTPPPLTMVGRVNQEARHAMLVGWDGGRGQERNCGELLGTGSAATGASKGSVGFGLGSFDVFDSFEVYRGRRGSHG